MNKESPCIIQRKRQHWHQSEPGTEELLEVEILFLPVNHSLCFPYMCRKKAVKTNEVTDFKYSSSQVTATEHQTEKQPSFSFPKVNVGLSVISAPQTFKNPKQRINI